MLTWEDLAAHALARQFPEEALTVPALVERTGPLQTQTARSTYLGLLARRPGLSAEEITAAFEAGEIVRGSTIRGTVHTGTPAQLTALGVATRVGLRRLWTGNLGLPDEQVEHLWAATERFAQDWRSVDELREHLAGWLAEHHPDSVERAGAGPGRYLAFACREFGLHRARRT